MFKLWAKKSLGQNFLVNPRVAQRIVEAADISPDDTILEVGPGTGILTRELLKSSGKIIAIEKDRRAIENLKTEFPAAEIIEGDVLEFKPSDHDLRAGGYKIVANLPYYITSHFIRTVFEEWPAPSLMVLMVQKEVAQRIMAKPPDMNLLALSIQYFSKPELITYVAPGNFKPTPKVDSAVIKLNLDLKTDKETVNQALSLAKKAFAGKRKQLKNTLPEIDFDVVKIKKESRPAELSLDDWKRLAEIVK